MAKLIQPSHCFKMVVEDTSVDYVLHHLQSAKFPEHTACGRWRLTDPTKWVQVLTTDVKWEHFCTGCLGPLKAVP